MKFILTTETNDPNEIIRLMQACKGVVSTVTTEDNDDDADNAPVNAGPAPTSDKNGLPWDDRIHSSSKKQTKAGEWCKRKGVDDATVAAVEHELRARVAAPQTPAFNPQHAFNPVANAVQTGYVAPQPQAPAFNPAQFAAPGLQAAAQQQPPQPLAMDFGTFIQRLSQNMQQNVTDQGTLEATLQKHGLTAVQQLAAAHPQQIGAFVNDLIMSGRWV